MTSKELLKEIESWLSFNTEPSKEEITKLRKSIKDHLTEQCAIPGVVESATPLKECMMGRDDECWHPKCPVTMEDAENGKYCTLPLYDYRQ